MNPVHLFFVLLHSCVFYFTSFHLRISPVYTSRNLDRAILETWFCLLTITAIPSWAMVWEVKTSSSLGFRLRLAMPISQVPSLAASIPEEESLVYKGKIFDKYPTSSYAEFINDPSYFEKLQEQEREASDFYSKTYEAFEQGQFYRVKMNTERAMKLYESDTAFMPRFAFLHAVAEGRLVSVDTMAFALYNLVRTYPHSSITPYAQRVLENVNEEYHIGLVLTDINKGEGGDKPEVKKAALYTYEPNTEHFAMIVCDSKSVRVAFNVKNVVLDDARTIITIGSFESQQKAADYITSMQMSDYVFGGIDKTKYKIIPISIKNYPLFYQSKDMDEYNTFYESNIKK